MRPREPTRPPAAYVAKDCSRGTARPDARIGASRPRDRTVSHLGGRTPGPVAVGRHGRRRHRTEDGGQAAPPAGRGRDHPPLGDLSCRRSQRTPSSRRKPSASFTASIGAFTALFDVPIQRRPRRRGLLGGRDLERASETAAAIRCPHAGEPVPGAVLAGRDDDRQTHRDSLPLPPGRTCRSDPQRSAGTLRVATGPG